MGELGPLCYLCSCLCPFHRLCNPWNSRLNCTGLVSLSTGPEGRALEGQLMASLNERVGRLNTSHEQVTLVRDFGARVVPGHSSAPMTRPAFQAWALEMVA